MCFDQTLLCIAGGAGLPQCRQRSFDLHKHKVSDGQMGKWHPFEYPWKHPVILSIAIAGTRTSRKSPPQYPNLQWLWELPGAVNQLCHLAVQRRKEIDLIPRKAAGQERLPHSLGHRTLMKRLFPKTALIQSLFQSSALRQDHEIWRHSQLPNP